MLEAVALIVILTAYAWVYLTHGLNMGGLYQADALYLPALMQDLLSQGGSYADWNLTPAPYFFPDWPMAAFSHVVAGGETYRAVLVFGLLQIGLTYVLLRAINYELFDDVRAVLFALASTAVITSMALDSVPYVQEVRISGHHYGGLLVILLSLWLVLRILRSSRPRWPHVVILCGLAFVTGLSDGLFVLQFGLAGLIAADILRRRQEISRSQFLAVGMLPAVSAFVGSRFTLMAMPRDHKLNYRFGEEYLDSNLDRVEFVVRVVLEADVLPLILLPLFLALTLGVLGVHIWKGTTLREHIGALHLLTYYIAVLGVMLVVALFISMPIPGRYLLPVFLLPVALLFVPLLLVRRRTVTIGIGALVGLLALGSIGKTVLPNGFDFQSSFYPGYIACIDRTLSEHGLRYGIAEYWTAKPVTMFSRADVEVVSVHNELREYHWLNNSSWFRSEYDFALINGGKPDAGRVRALNGEPQFTEQCGGITVLGYGPGDLVTSEPGR